MPHKYTEELLLETDTAGKLFSLIDIYKHNGWHTKGHPYLDLETQVYSQKVYKYIFNEGFKISYTVKEEHVSEGPNLTDWEKLLLINYLKGNSYSMAEIKVKYKKDTPELKVLKQGDWIDLAVPSEVKLSAGEFKVIDLGLAMSLPEGTEAHIVPRSSTFKKWGIILANQIGIIDNSYSGDNDYWQAPLYALRDTTIPRGTRILQFRIVPTMMSTYPNLSITKVDKLQGPNRGGLGSTGN